MQTHLKSCAPWSRIFSDIHSHGSRWGRRDWKQCAKNDREGSRKCPSSCRFCSHHHNFRPRLGTCDLKGREKKIERTIICPPSVGYGEDWAVFTNDMTSEIKRWRLQSTLLLFYSHPWITVNPSPLSLIRPFFVPIFCNGFLSQDNGRYKRFINKQLRHKSGRTNYCILLWSDASCLY